MKTIQNKQQKHTINIEFETIKLTDNSILVN